MFWRRRGPKRPPGREAGRETAERRAQGRFREVEEQDRAEDAGAFDPAFGHGADDLWESGEFTQPEGSDGGELPSVYDEDEPDAVESGILVRFGAGARDAPPETGVRKPHVVSTLLSRKPGKGAAWAVVWTLGILLVVSVLYWWGPPGFAAVLPASGEAVFERGETWRLLTALAAHADPIHLLSNAVFLTWLIYLSYGAFGASLYPWSAVPLAAAALAVTLEGYPPNIRVVGASGMLYLLAGAWLMLYVLVERRLSVLKRLVRVVGFFLVVLVPTSIRPEVSYRAHAIGLFFGICLGLAYFLARRDSIRQGERWEWEDG